MHNPVSGCECRGLKVKVQYFLVLLCHKQQIGGARGAGDGPPTRGSRDKMNEGVEESPYEFTGEKSLREELVGKFEHKRRDEELEEGSK